MSFLVKKTIGCCKLSLYFIISFLILGVSANLFAANKPNGESQQISDLWRHLENFTTFQGHFTQKVFNLKMPEFRAKRSQGQVWLQKPNLFRWKINNPDNQLIVSNGVYIWIYDKDLKQVTQRPYQNNNGDIADLLLSGRAAFLKPNYNVKVLSSSKSGGSQQFLLQPKAKDAVLRDIGLSFTQGVLRQLRVTDSLGKKTTFTFSKVELNKAITKKLFTFTIPKGVDLIREQGENVAHD